MFCTLTNNSARGKGKPALTDAPLGADAANPRAPNTMGHIVRWQRGRRRSRGHAASSGRCSCRPATRSTSDPLKRGNVKDQVAFAQPDGLYFDERGVLWIQTDSSSQNMAGKDWDGIGNNQMLAADPTTGEVRRFLTAPVGSEVTGIAMAPDLRTLFVNIQHPGEAPLAHPGRNDPKQPAGPQHLARRPRRRPPALGHHRHPPHRRGSDRHLKSGISEARWPPGQTRPPSTPPSPVAAAWAGASSALHPARTPSGRYI